MVQGRVELTRLLGRVWVLLTTCGILYTLSKMSIHTSVADAPSVNSKVGTLVSAGRELSCAPQCTNFIGARCEQLADLALGEPNCLLLARPSLFVAAVTEVVLGLPISGACNSSSTGGCSTTVPFDAEARNWGNDWPPTGYSMMGRVRLLNIRASIDDVNRNDIPGAIVELGVWRGGGMMLASAVNIESKVKRDIYLFDNFGKIESYKHHEDYLSVNVDAVKQGFETLHLMNHHIHFEVGLFQDTVPSWPRHRSIAVLRVDGNFYDSYQDAMYYLYESVEIGGIVIFDDIMSHEAVHEFWNDFTKDQNIGNTLHRIDFHSAWFRKSESITIDWQYFRAPRDAYKLSSTNCPAEIRKKSKGNCHSSWTQSTLIS